MDPKLTYFIVLCTAGEPSGPQFEALVDKYHARYVTELKQLFNDHKEKYAKEAANLELVE